MTTQIGAEAFLPVDRTLEGLAMAAKDCRGCELYKSATQTVFGEGAKGAAIMLVGEQPGDHEDRAGVPFVGPAGGMLDRALFEAGIARDEAYVTNAVKHFKWTPRGKRRIHETPRVSEMRACLPWLEAEIEAVRPRLVIALGATAVSALLGTTAKVLRDRGRVIESSFGPCLVTVHPSSLLRAEDEEARRLAYELFVRDLKQGVAFLARFGVAKA